MCNVESQTQSLRAALGALQLEINHDVEFAGIFETLRQDYEAAKEEPNFVESNWFGRLTTEQSHQSRLLMEKKGSLSTADQEEDDWLMEIQRRFDVPYNNFYHAFTSGTYPENLYADHPEVMRVFDDTEIGARMRKALKLKELQNSVNDAGILAWRGGEFGGFETLSQEFQEQLMTATLNTALASAVTAAYDYLQEAEVDVENYTGR